MAVKAKEVVQGVMERMMVKQVKEIEQKDWEKGIRPVTLEEADRMTAGGGYTLIPNFIFDYLISDRAKLIYTFLLSYAWADKLSSYPGQQNLSNRLHLGEKALRRYIKELREAGLIRITRRGQGKTNLYTLPMKAAATLKVKKLQAFTSKP